MKRALKLKECGIGNGCFEYLKIAPGTKNVDAEMEKLLGDAIRRRRSTAIFLAENPKCCFCGGGANATTRDHYPPRAIFDGSNRPDDLVVPACVSCNSLSRDADQIVAAICRWRLGGVESDAEDRDGRKLARGLARNRPDILEEWFSRSLGTQQKRARRILEERGVPVTLDTKVARLGPITIPYLHLFSYKLTLATYYAQIRRALPANGVVRAFFRTKEDVAVNAVPEEMLQQLGQNITLRQGNWNVGEQFEYKFARDESGSVFAMAARIRYGLLVFGFAAIEKSALADVNDEFCISPSELKNMLIDPVLKKRA